MRNWPCFRPREVLGAEVGRGGMSWGRRWSLGPVPATAYRIPPKRTSAQKGSGRDPELSQLLRLVLQKLGSEDSSEVTGSPEEEGGSDRGKRPKRSHVAPSAAFPPVKRRRNGKALVLGSINLTPPTAVSVPAQITLPDTLAPPTGPPSAPPAAITGNASPPSMGMEGVLADIRKSLAALVPTAQPGASPTPPPGLVAPTSSGSPPVRVPEHQGQEQNPLRLALLEVAKLLAGINAPSSTVPPLTAPWGLGDSWQNAVSDLKHQAHSLVAAHTSAPLQPANSSSSAAPAPSAGLPSPPGVPNVLPSTSKVPDQVNTTKEGTTDSLLSRPGKLAAHVSAEVKEKIWKGEFVDIFSLIRAKRREVEVKEKETKSSFYGERKPKVEESITNWLFAFNVFMSVLLEKKTELAYDRDFRWAKVEDPSIGWDQTEVNIWLECVNNKVSGKLPFRPQLSGEKKGSCWAFNRKMCTRPTGTCKFRHNCSFCGHPSHPESKCIKKSKERGKDSVKSSN
ncbi:hypothetical protein NDU88_008715 [Pleurodeles waltl]|uniref:C3H1-type domain-containing protein n=1 Tax=Pleurodeles waltl TaxID=8319 RepID=A0AAV7PPY0_PLEWA|nr:hypothetical protein NDU88_008715 [Pleurodeles waltl]